MAAAATSAALTARIEAAVGAARRAERAHKVAVVHHRVVVEKSKRTRKHKRHKHKHHKHWMDGRIMDGMRHHLRHRVIEGLAHDGALLIVHRMWGRLVAGSSVHGSAAARRRSRRLTRASARHTPLSLGQCETTL